MSKVSDLIEKSMLYGKNSTSPYSRQINISTGSTYIYNGKVVMVVDFDKHTVGVVGVKAGKPSDMYIKVPIDKFYKDVNAI